jgi:hypothetical protein
MRAPIAPGQSARLRGLRQSTLRTGPPAQTPRDALLTTPPQNGPPFSAKRKRPQRYNARVVAIDAEARVARLAGGGAVRYGRLLTTLPLDTTLAWLGAGGRGEGLRRSSSHIIGVGLRGAWWVAGGTAPGGGCRPCCLVITHPPPAQQ